MFRAGLKAGLVQLLSFFLSLLPRSLGLSFGGCFFIVALLVFVGAGAWAGQMLGQPPVRRGLGAGSVAGLIAGLAQGLTLALSAVLGLALLHLTGELSALIDPADWPRIQELGGDPFQSLLTMMLVLTCGFGGPIFLALGTALGAIGGAVHAVVMRKAPALALTGDDEREW